MHSYTTTELQGWRRVRAAGAFLIEAVVFPNVHEVLGKSPDADDPAC